MTPANSPPDTGVVVVEDGRIPGKGWYLMSADWPTIATAHLADVGGKIGATKGVFALGAYQAIRLSRLAARALPERREGRL